MKKIRNVAADCMPWAPLLVAAELFFVFLLWLASPAALGGLAAVLTLFTFFLLLIGYCLTKRKRQKQMALAQKLLSGPDGGISPAEPGEAGWISLIRQAARQLARQSKDLKTMRTDAAAYREFVEAWAHEIKTPLSLATLVLDNNADEMSPYVHSRMERVRYSINEQVERILYYARLQASPADYRFEKVNLRDCVEESLDNFRMLMEEKKTEVRLELSPLTVVSDKRTLLFILSQIFSNAFKYADAGKGVVRVTDGTDEKKGNIYLDVWNNGAGVAPEDAPFVFDKGFTGSREGRNSATGMGLYLVRKFAEALSIHAQTEALSSDGKGFGIRLVFPVIHL